MKKFSLMILLLFAGVSMAQGPASYEEPGGETGSYKASQHPGPQNAGPNGKQAQQAAPKAPEAAPQGKRAPEQSAPKEKAGKKEEKASCKKLGSFTACYDD